MPQPTGSDGCGRHGAAVGQAFDGLDGKAAPLEDRDDHHLRALVVISEISGDIAQLGHIKIVEIEMPADLAHDRHRDLVLPHVRHEDLVIEKTQAIDVGMRVGSDEDQIERVSRDHFKGSIARGFAVGPGFPGHHRGNEVCSSRTERLDNPAFLLVDKYNPVEEPVELDLQVPEEAIASPGQAVALGAPAALDRSQMTR